MALSEEFLNSLAACKTADELRAAIEDAGIELPDEVLDAVAGGTGETDDESYEKYNTLDGEGISPEMYQRIVLLIEQSQQQPQSNFF